MAIKKQYKRLLTVKTYTFKHFKQYKVEKYEATVTAPSKSSYNQSGHYYGVTVKATDVAGNITTKDAADATLGKSLRYK